MIGGWFISGTDTGVGKTWVAEALLLALRAGGRRAAGMKPVASGCHRDADGLRSEDAERLRVASEALFEYRDVNPYAFEPPIAPHIAAARAGVEMQLDVVQRHFHRLSSTVDWVVVEGVGGWRVPFNRTLDMNDVARAFGLPVVLVVGIKLGCVNHAQLTATAIRADGVALAGWIANRIDPEFDAWEETVAALEERLAAPLLGVADWTPVHQQMHQGQMILRRLLP